MERGGGGRVIRREGMRETDGGRIESEGGRKEGLGGEGRVCVWWGGGGEKRERGPCSQSINIDEVEQLTFVSLALILLLDPAYVSA